MERGWFHLWAGRGLGLREPPADWPVLLERLQGLRRRGAERRGDREHGRPARRREGGEHGRRGGQERDGLLREALRRWGLRSSATPADAASDSDAFPACPVGRAWAVSARG